MKGSEVATSIIIARRGRAAALQRCLMGVRLLDHVNFEVVVVADAPGIAAVQELGLAQQVKLVEFDGANISEARNRGIAVASGEVCAFIDDDAVPEPTWLSRLVEPFADRGVASAGGFVRGRNGISFQWRASLVDRNGRTVALEVDETRTTLHRAPAGHAVRTEGTNMAHRRSVLAAVGGFDPAFRFYCDETDLNMRLAPSGKLTAIVPLAQVHHGFKASERRRADRVPTTLREIGASTAIYLRKHAAEEDHFAAVAALIREQRVRALRHMVSGAIEPRDVRYLMRDLEQGIEEGFSRPLSRPAALAGAEHFLHFEGTGPRPARVLGGWIWQRQRLQEEAERLARFGAVVTVFRFSPTAVFHRMRFKAPGYWEQSGGLFGRSDRNASLFRLFRLHERVRRECDRVAAVRPIDTLLG